MWRILGRPSHNIGASVMPESPWSVISKSSGQTTPGWPSFMAGCRAVVDDFAALHHSSEPHMSRYHLRRLRQDPHIRALTREARPHPEQFIQPLFVVEGTAQARDHPGSARASIATPRPRCWRRSSRTWRPASASSCCLACPQRMQRKAIDWSFTSGQVASHQEALRQGRVAGRRCVPVFLDAAWPLRRAESPKAITSTMRASVEELAAAARGLCATPAPIASRPAT